MQPKEKPMRDKTSLKESDNNVVSHFTSPAGTVKALPTKAMQSSEDIHVGPNTQLSGGFNTNGMMIVDGRVDNADIAADRLVVSHIGNLEGKASVHRAEISGVFSGELFAGDEVIVRPTARISGSVHCQKLVIHRGARIECTFSCVPELVTDGSPRPMENGSVLEAIKKFNRTRQMRDRKMFLAGAGTIFAIVGMVTTLIVLRVVTA
jgi:cytoskeletal protein CcmA (bactofilin family)